MPQNFFFTACKYKSLAFKNIHNWVVFGCKIVNPSGLFIDFFFAMSILLKLYFQKNKNEAMEWRKEVGKNWPTEISWIAGHGPNFATQSQKWPQILCVKGDRAQQPLHWITWAPAQNSNLVHVRVFSGGCLGGCCHQSHREAQCLLLYQARGTWRNPGYPMEGIEGRDGWNARWGYPPASFAFPHHQPSSQPRRRSL